MAGRKRGKGKRAEWERRRADDAVMANLAQLMLDEPGGYYRIKPEMRDAMWRRFLELLKRELARWPANRPKLSTGQLVAQLAEATKSEKRGIMLAAKITKLKPQTVARRYREHKQQQREQGEGGGK